MNKDERALRLGDVPYYGATGQVGWIDEPIFDEELVLLGEDGAPFLNPLKPKAYLIDGPSWVNNHAHVLRAKREVISNRFLMHYLNGCSYEGHVTGTTRLKLNQAAMRAMPFLVPPRPEQERIVAAIEEHLSRLDAAEASVEAGAQRAALLFEAALRSELEQVGAHATSLVDLLVQPLSNGRSVRTATVDGSPVLRLTCLRNGLIDTAETKLGDWGDDDPTRFQVEPDDFLISRGNGSLHLVGRGGLVPADALPVAFPDTLIRARVDPSVMRPAFLRLVWNGRATREQLESQARTTAGIYKVNQSMLERVNLPLPPVDAQDGIVRRLMDVHDSVQQVEAEISRARLRVRALRRSILAAAFSGKLVPQNPNDEPASALLDRITAERAAAKPTPKTRRKKASV